MESKRHSQDLEKDLTRDVHKAEWKMKEQKLEDDIKTLREQLLLLVSLPWFSVLLLNHALTPEKQSPSPARINSCLCLASRIEKGLLLTTAATPCWSHRPWIRR